MAFELKSRASIMRDMIAEFLSNSNISDFNRGSVISTLLEAAATEDFNQYFQMVSIINNYFLDNVAGTDLDNRAIEYGLDGRLSATKATTVIKISDSSFDKIFTKIYAGLSGPIKGQNKINVDNASSFPSSGSIIIGRGTSNVETISYSSISFGTNFDVINLNSNLNFDHSTNESVILSQGGDRVIGAGTVVKVPATDYSKDIAFSVDNEETMLDGNNELDGIAVTALSSGTDSNVPSGAINTFDTKPFPSAVVTNEQKVTNARDDETDSELRNRIRDHVQSLSRGTPTSLISGIVGIVDPTDNKRVISANYIDATDSTDISKMVIDDGTGFEASSKDQGFENVISNSTGGEEFVNLDLFPIIKANVTTINSEPYALTGGMYLIYSVNQIQETFIFEDSDFEIQESATAQEVVTAINNRSSLIEARTTDNQAKIEIRARSNTNEVLEIVNSDSANDSSVLNFPVGVSETLKLYKFNGSTLKELSKDGMTAFIDSGNQQPYNFATIPTYLDILLDYDTMFESSITVVGGVSVFTDNDLNSKFLNDNDLVYKYVVFEDQDTKYLIDSYDSATNTITLTGAVSITPSWTYKILNSRRIFFSNKADEDFENPSVATAQEVANVFNKYIYGIASLISNNTKIRLISKLENSSSSKIEILGGTAESILNFPTGEVSGADKDYTLNRFNGQIRLFEVLQVGDQITAGSRMTRGFIIGKSSQPYDLDDGDILQISIDGGSPQNILFEIADFSNINQASAQEVVDVINEDLVGGYAEVTNDNKIYIQTNTFNESIGSIEVTSISGTAGVLGFSSGDISQSITPHYASILSGHSGINYNFVEDDNLVVVLDNDIENKTYDIKMNIDGTVSGVQSGSEDQIFIAKITSLDQNFYNKFDENGELVGMRFIVKSASNAVIINEERIISAYDSSNGKITLSLPLSGDLTAGDEFIIIPVTTKNIVDFISNSAASTLNISANIVQADNGGRIQISTKTDGSNGYINITGGTANKMESLFLISGSGNDIWVESALWKIGMDITLSDDDSASADGVIMGVTADDPSEGIYKLTLSINADDFTVDKNATISRRNVLDFSQEVKQGIAAYKYYTGLLRRVQKTIDGVESNREFPGLKAAGAQIEVIPPTVQKLKFEIDITLEEGISISTVVDDIKNAVGSYINSLRVGEDVILAEIVRRIKAISGLYDVEIISPTDNIPIADTEIARIDDNQIIVG